MCGDEGADGDPIEAPDVLTGGGGQDKVEGGPGPDTLKGGDQNDLVEGLGGNDTLHGGDGPNDTLRAGDGDDYLDGDLGDSDLCHIGYNDTVVMGSAANNWDGCEDIQFHE